MDVLTPVSYTHLDVYKRQPSGGVVEQALKTPSAASSSAPRRIDRH